MRKDRNRGFGQFCYTKRPDISTLFTSIVQFLQHFLVPSSQLALFQNSSFIHSSNFFPRTFKGPNHSSLDQEQYFYDVSGKCRFGHTFEIPCQRFNGQSYCLDEPVCPECGMPDLEEEHTYPRSYLAKLLKEIHQENRKNSKKEPL